LKLISLSDNASILVCRCNG